MIRIDESRCVGCGMCAADCVARHIEVVDGRAREKEGSCIGCGHCLAICPMDAVEVDGYDRSDVTDCITGQEVLDPQELLQVIRSRRSVRRFLDRPVEREKLEMMIEAGRHAPTGSNSQSVSYVVLQENVAEATDLFWEGMRVLAQKGGMESMLERYRAYKEEGKDTLFYGAPAVIVLVARSEWDAGLAAANMEMMALAQGLGVMHCGFAVGAARVHPPIGEYLGLEAGERVAICMTVGYPAVAYARTAPRKPARIHWK